jgi:hypothetical protein
LGDSYLSRQAKDEINAYMRAYKKGARGDDLPKLSQQAKDEKAEYMRLYRQYRKQYGKKGAKGMGQMK